MPHSPESPHDQRTSTCTGANMLASGRKHQQSQLTTEQTATSENTSQQLGTSYKSGSIACTASTPPSSMSVRSIDDLDSIYREIIRQEMDELAVQAYFDADAKPPITQESLAELDMGRIIHNHKLRHDVNFDRELHFRPNLDGCKGQQKLKQADQYWAAVEVELLLYNYVKSRLVEDDEEGIDWELAIKQSLRRLEAVFTAIREIMQTLVPEYDLKAVEERLDVNHIMQEIRNGVCNLSDLANWLAKVLKRHCAPMRDKLVDAMREEVERGVRENSHAYLVNGLRQLMTILEAMKLDVANHQIQQMLRLLISDTINFQRRVNEERIKTGKHDPFESKLWLDSEANKPTFAESGPLDRLDAFVSALVRDIVLNDEDSICPPAFYLDSDRLQLLRIELHSLVYHTLCREVFQDLAGSIIDQSHISNIYDILWTSISAIVGIRGKFEEMSENIAVEIVRLLQSIKGRYPPIDEALLESAESKLKDCLQPQSESFKRVATEICWRIVPKLRKRVKSLTQETAISLHDELVPLVISRPSILGYGAICEPVPVRPTLPIDPDSDIVRRMTHMLVLHWQVWWDLVYDPVDTADDNLSDDASGSTSSSASTASSTTPVEHTVYGSRRQWPSIIVTVTDDANDQLPTPSPTPPPVPPAETNQVTASNTNEHNSEDASNPSVDSEQNR